MEFALTKPEMSCGFSVSHINQLWHVFVLAPNFPKESAVFFNFLMRRSPSKYFSRNPQRQLIIPEINREQLFLHYFLDKKKFSPEALNITAYTCLIRYFVEHNIYVKIMKQERGELVYLKGKVEGLEEIWDLAYASSSREVKELFAKDVCNVYSGVYRSGRIKFPDALNSFVEQNMKYASRSTASKKNIDYFLLMLKKFVYRFEALDYERVDKARYKAAPTVVKSVEAKLVSGTVDLKLKVNQHLTLRDFKNFVSYSLKISKNWLKLMTAKSKIVINADNENYLVRDCGNSIINQRS